MNEVEPVNNLAWHLAHKYRVGRFELEDLYQSAILGWLKSPDHDPQKGPLGPYASMCMVHEIQKTIFKSLPVSVKRNEFLDTPAQERKKYFQLALAFNEPSEKKEKPEAPSANWAAEDPQTDQRIERVELIRRLVSVLNQREREYVVRFFWGQETLTNLDKGLSRERNRQIFAKAIEKMRQHVKRYKLVYG